MNVTFRIGEEIGNTGYRIIDTNGLSRFVAQKDAIRIYFESDSGEGKNYSKVLSYTNIPTNRTYQAMRYLHKYVTLVQAFSNVLFDKYRDANPDFKAATDPNNYVRKN